MLKRYFESLRLIRGNADARRELCRYLGSVLWRGVLGICFAAPMILSLVKGVSCGIALQSPYSNTVKLIAALACFTLVYITSAFFVIGFCNGCTTLLVRGFEVALNQLALDEPRDSDHGQTIAEVIARIHNQPVEYCAVFDDDETKVGECTTLQTGECRLPDSDAFGAMPRYSGIMIHNHPQNNGTFSASDFATIISNGFRKGIVVTSKLIFTLEVPRNVMEEADWYQLQDDLEEILSRLDDTPESVSLFWSNRDIVWYGVCQAIVQQYGMTLTVENFSQCKYVKEYRKARRQAFFKTVFGVYSEPDEAYSTKCPQGMLVATPKSKKNKRR